MKIYIEAFGLYYRANVTTAWAKKHDNGALISRGLTVGADFSARVLSGMIATGTAAAVTREEYNHSGCQSSCKLRGDSSCTW